MAGSAAGAERALAAETLDRVVASVGVVAITSSDAQQEYRFERFLDGQWPPPAPDAAALDAACQHLTYQMLLTQEENPGPADQQQSAKAAAARLAALRREYPRPGEFERALRDLGLSEAEVTERIVRQELMLRMIDERLLPEATPGDDDVAAYYRSTFVPEFQKRHGGTPPPLADVEHQIREILTQKQINKLLEQWLDELKPTTNVRFHSG